MKPMTKGLIVALIHVGLVTSLGAKFLWERATFPRVWVRVMPYDPELPLRGRYLRLRALIDDKDVHFPDPNEDRRPYDGGGWSVTLSVQSNRLIATVVPAAAATSVHLDLPFNSAYVVHEDVAFFIPEHIADPSRRPAGEQLWMESTIPKQGPPRPIRLGVRRGDGAIVPLPID